jgi:hypothetical protein
MAKINPFGKAQVERSAMDIMTESFGIGVRPYDRGHDVWNSSTGKWEFQSNETDEVVIEFAVNEGKGTGRQCIPASEFRQYVGVLRSIINSGFEEGAGPDRTEYIPTHSVAQESFKMIRPRVVGHDGKVVEDHTADRDVVSVRCTTGKGAKPMFVHKSEFTKVVEVLSQVAESLDEYEAQAWDNYSSVKK